MSHCWLKKDEISEKKGLLQRSQNGGGYKKIGFLEKAGFEKGDHCKAYN